MLAAALSSLAFSSRQAPRLHQSRAGPVAASVDRRAVLGAAAAALAAVPAASFADKPAASDGKWAQHDQDEAFTDADFAGFSTSPSGLQYKIVQEGYGVKPKTGQGIKAHYSGYLLKGAKFDSSYERRKPLGFDVGTGKVIKGWDEALLDMKLGELVRSIRKRKKLSDDVPPLDRYMDKL